MQVGFEEVILDVSRPVLDLSCKGIQVLQLGAATQDVKALVLTGNPLEDLGFLGNFRGLRVLHADSVGLAGLIDLQFQRLPSITGVVLRLNRLRSFKSLRGSETLELLDVSQNPFDPCSEETLQCAFPRLRRFSFGFVCGASGGSCPAYSFSLTNLNTFSMLKQAFLAGMYSDSEISYGDPKKACINNLQFTLSCSQKQVQITVHKTSDATVRDAGCLVSCFAILAGFDIFLTKRVELPLSQLAAGAHFDMAEDFKFDISEYPTSQTNSNALDKRIFLMLQTRRNDQLALKQNFNAVVIETQEQAAVFVLDRRSGVLFEFGTLVRTVQQQIDAPSPIRSSLMKTSGAEENAGLGLADLISPGHSLAGASAGGSQAPGFQPIRFSESPRMFQRLFVTGRAGLQTVDFYVTDSTRDSLAIRFQGYVRDITGGDKIPVEICLEQIQYAVNSFSRRPGQILEEQKEQFIILPVLYKQVEYPVRVKLTAKQKTIREEGMYVNAVCQGRFVVADCQYADGFRTVIVSPGPVQYLPQNIEVFLEHSSPLLIANVRENVDGKQRKSVYRFFKYTWSRGSEILRETQAPILDLVKFAIYPDGMFKCTVEVCDENFNPLGQTAESNGVYLRTEESLGKERQRADLEEQKNLVFQPSELQLARQSAGAMINQNYAFPSTGAVQRATQRTAKPSGSKKDLQTADLQ